MSLFSLYFFHRVNFALNNRTAFWFHVTNILIHASVSIFVLVLCSGVLQMSLCAALTSSAIFALHPIHTEAVSYLQCFIY